MNRAAPLLLRAAALSLSLAALPGGARAELPALIPRQVLSGDPEKTRPLISPDGQQLAYRALDPRGVGQIWVRALGKADDRVVTREKTRGPRELNWAYNGTLLYAQDQDGDENYHLFGVDPRLGTVRDLTPFQGIRSNLIALDPKHPDLALVQMNVRTREAFDVYRLNLKNGALELDTENPGDVAAYSAWIADHSLAVRAAVAITPEGGTEVRVRPGRISKRCAASSPSAWETWTIRRTRS